MMKRIDFLGAPGVGKSTIYQALLSSEVVDRKNKYYSEEMASIYAVQKHIKQERSIVSLLTRLILRIKTARSPYVSSIEEKINKASFEQFVSRNLGLFELVDKAYCLSNKSPYRNQYGYVSFNRKIKKYAVLEKYFPYIVIADESVSQKIYGINPSSDELHIEVIEKYFLEIPPPDILIHCIHDEADIVNRILTRSKMIPGHKGLTERELKQKTKLALRIAEIGASILQERGTEVIQIDTSSPVDKNVQKILNLMNKKKL